MPAFEISIDRLTFAGSGLNRPECVLATAKGNIYTSDWDGGVACLSPDGHQRKWLAKNAAFAIKPNGIALNRDGSFLLAHLGGTGGLYRLHRDGRLEPVLTEIGGTPLPPSNFVLLDSRERIWLTVSTRRRPRARGYRPDVDDGFIVRLDAAGARIAADGLGYTNEIQFDASENWLYCNETFARRLSRFPVLPDGSLGNRETVAVFGAGTYPDGLTFDADGGIWVTSIVSNRVIRITPDGRQQLLLEDADPIHVAEVETAFLDGRMGRSHLDNVRSRCLRNISSLAFGGPDLKTGYLGCLLGDSLATFRSPVAGRPPVHWNFD